MKKRVRRVGSIKNELIAKARESMLSAVQIFNSPNILFKSETFVVLSIISWTYLMHAYYRTQKIDYRYFHSDGKRKKYDRTKRGAYKYWELERCLDTPFCLIDQPTKDNLKFLIGLRHEIEHQMTNRIDDYLSAKFQACCINFNHYVIKYFGHEYGIEKHLSISLQFASIEEPQVKQLQEFTDLPNNISSYIINFEGLLPNEEFNDPRYSYRVLYIPKVVNNKGQADKVIEFLPANSPAAEGLNREYVLIKDREKPKYLAGDVVKKMQEKGYKKFKMHQHTLLWKSEDAKNTSKGFGAWVANKSWYWYESWITFVENYCQQHNEEYL